MTARPSLLFHCQHSLGIGHLARSLALAESLSERYRVVLLSGGPLPQGTRVPRGVELIALPALGIALDGGLVSRDPDRGVERSLSLRTEMILDAFRRLRPRVVLVELFPFGRKKLSGELLPLLEEARASSPPPIIVSSVRDILVSRPDQERHDERACLVANRYFDAVLVHSDARVVRFEESFRPRTPLRVRVHHTGFVVTPRRPPLPPRGGHSGAVLVSAGGGRVGEPLLHAAIEAHAMLGTGSPPMRLVAGPFLPEEGWRSLRSASFGHPRLTLRRSVSDLGAELGRSRASVSQCGYNTALDLVCARIPALVVPFADGQEDEQAKRAERLAGLGLVRVLDPSRLDGAALAAELRSLPSFRPAAAEIDLDGARETVAFLTEVEATRARHAPRSEAWVDPVLRALDDRDTPCDLFFRDDDAGWAEARLLALLDLFAHRSLPLDLAVIPSDLTRPLARELRRRVAAADGRLGLHQHGLAHVNHEPSGRRYEFGPSRARRDHLADIRSGRRRLVELLGGTVQPIFTPPWNRCTRATAECVTELGFRALSREHRAEPLAVPGLVELPVHLDWSAHRHDSGLDCAELGQRLAAVLADSSGPVGIMLHHELMDAGELRDLAALLDRLASHGAVRARSMLTLVDRVVEQAA